MKIYDSVVVGGFIGNQTQWSILAKAWCAKLRQPFSGFPPLRQFHLSQSNARRGEFDRYSEAEVAALTWDFRHIIIESGVYCIAYVIDKKAWDSLIPMSYAKSALGNAEERCLRHCVSRSVGFARVNNTKIELMFDAGRESKRLNNLFRSYKKWNAAFPELISLKFGKVTKFIPLQVADYIATELYWFCGRWFNGGDPRPVRAHFTDYVKNGRGEFAFIDRTAIEHRLTRGKSFLTLIDDMSGLIEAPQLPVP